MHTNERKALEHVFAQYLWICIGTRHVVVHDVWKHRPVCSRFYKTQTFQYKRKIFKPFMVDFKSITIKLFAYGYHKNKVLSMTFACNEWFLHWVADVWVWAGSSQCCSPVSAEVKSCILPGLLSLTSSHPHGEASTMQRCLLSSLAPAVCQEKKSRSMQQNISLKINNSRRQEREGKKCVSYMWWHTDLFSQVATWSSVQGSWAGVERRAEAKQSLWNGRNNVWMFREKKKPQGND